MAAFMLRGPDYSATKKKALEDARSMQASVVRQCRETRREPPPYMFLELIGKGSFGRVYKARSIATAPQKLVAIKIINIEAADSACPGGADTFGDILKEINALKLLGTSGAKNVNTIVDALLVGQSMWMVTEYCAGGSVSSLMRPTGCLPERWIIPILRETAEALYWVHKQGIIHRDVKCANILVTDAGAVQLCDFGVSAVVETKFDKRSTVTGTLQWMAPELFDSSVSYGIEVDIWAFGAMAYEAASGLPPNATTAVDFLDFNAYLKEHCPRLEGDRYSPELKDFVSHCMVIDPARRPAIDQVQKHPYIFNTSGKHPTSSLSKLVSAYKLWETQGGSRHSLFSRGGAQFSTDSGSRAPEEEWDFSTMVDSLRFLPDEADNEMVYDAYHPQVDAPDRTLSSRQRRRLPPNMKAPIAPLEKAFNPHTLTNYKDNVRVFYNRSNSLLTPEQPLPEKQNNQAARTSLIDLDESLNTNDLPWVADYEAAQSFSNEAASSDKRKTQDWTFPAAPASASPDSLPPQYHNDSQATDSSDKRKTQDWTFPLAPEPTSSDSLPPQSCNDSEVVDSDRRNPQDWTFPVTSASASPDSLPPQHHGGGQVFDTDRRRTQDWTFPVAPALTSPHTSLRRYNDRNEISDAPLEPERPLSASSRNQEFQSSLDDLDESLNTSDLAWIANFDETAQSFTSETSETTDSDRRKTQDWAFPVATPGSTSADPDTSLLQSNGDSETSDLRPTPELPLPEERSHQRRPTSLIDLDASFGLDEIVDPDEPLDVDDLSWVADYKAAQALLAEPVDSDQQKTKDSTFPATTTPPANPDTSSYQSEDYGEPSEIERRNTRDRAFPVTAPASISQGSLPPQSNEDSEVAADPDQRRTRDRTFPATTPNPISPEPARPSQSNEDGASILSIPHQTQSLHRKDDSITDTSTIHTIFSAPSSRDSTLSLIDLDGASLASVLTDATTPPATTGPGSGSEKITLDFKDVVFDLEPLTLRNPSAPTTREPSLYIPNDTPRDAPESARNDLVKAALARRVSTTPRPRSRSRTGSVASASSLPTNPSAQTAQAQEAVGTAAAASSASSSGNSKEEVRDELRRMTSSLNEHLQNAARKLRGIPTRQQQN